VVIAVSRIAPDCPDESKRRPRWFPPPVRRRRSLWPLLLLLGLLSCSKCPPGEPDLADDPTVIPTSPPEVASVEIIPSPVYVTSDGARFQLRARLRDSAGNIISEDWTLPLSWTWNPPPAASFTAGASVDLEIEASVGAASDVAEIRVVPASDATGDRIVAEVPATEPPAPPSVALVDGQATLEGGTTTCIIDSGDEPIAFVGVAPLPGNMVGDCTTPPVVGALALLTPGKELVYGTASWLPEAGDLANFTATATPADAYQHEPGPPRELKVKIWIPHGADAALNAAGETPDQQVTSELGVLDWIFSTSLAGISVVPDGPLREATLGELQMGEAGVKLKLWDCLQVKDRVPSDVASEFGPDVLSVLYVLDLWKYDEDDAMVDAGYRGFACRPGPEASPERDALGGIVLIEWGDREPETLAHEIGHMLGLHYPPLPEFGHTRYLTGFNRTHNLMWTGDDSPRDHLSVGQVFRMNVDEHSWLNRAGVAALLTGVTRECQCDPYSTGPRDPGAGPEVNNWCPKLWLDVSRPTGNVADPPPPTCPYVP